MRKAKVRKNSAELAVLHFLNDIIRKPF